jgi:hypothetical protein
MSIIENLDNIHYEIESIGGEYALREVEDKIKDLQYHVENQLKRIIKIKSFDCEKVRELPSEIVKLIESFMYDDIDTIQKAYCIRGLYFKVYDLNIRNIQGLNIQERYIYHIFKKYDRKKLWSFIHNHKLLLYEDFPLKKSLTKYELVKYIYRAIKIDDFNWYGKGLLYQTKYNYVFKTFDENNFDGRVLDIQYRTYQILKVVSTSPQPLT